MLELVICDDEKSLRTDLKKIIERELDLCGHDCRITEFNCGEDLIRTLNTRNYDIFFLDIEMKELDGMETAKHIRNKNTSAEIIFVTSHPDFVFQGYEVRALNYILKPYEEKKILSVLYAALEHLSLSAEKYYLIEQRSGTIKLPLSRTKYFISERRSITAVTTDTTYTFYGKLNDMETELPDFFIRIHNRYLCNLNYIDSIDANSAICGKELLPVSRSCKQNLTIAFAKYMLK